MKHRPNSTTIIVLTFAAIVVTLPAVADSSLDTRKAPGGTKNQSPAAKDRPKATSDEYPRKFAGNASWYGAPFNGRKTASGEIFDMNKLTAAHLRLPLPTKILVENPRNGNVAFVRVNDRGPYVKNRVLDLSRESAKRVGTLSMGVGYVECLVLPNKSTPSKTPSAGDKAQQK